MQLDRFVVSWRVVQRVLMSFRCPAFGEGFRLAPLYGACRSGWHGWRGLFMLERLGHFGHKLVKGQTRIGVNLALAALAGNGGHIATREGEKALVTGCFFMSWTSIL